MNDKLIEVATVAPVERVGRAINQLKERYGRSDPDGVVIEHSISVEYLVGLTLLYRADVERVMKQWEYENIIVWERGTGKLTLKRPDRIPA
jgi:hypothetical protein